MFSFSLLHSLRSPATIEVENHLSNSPINSTSSENNKINIHLDDRVIESPSQLTLHFGVMSPFRTIQNNNKHSNAVSLTPTLPHTKSLPVTPMNNSYQNKSLNYLKNKTNLSETKKVENKKTISIFDIETIVCDNKNLDNNNDIINDSNIYLRKHKLWSSNISIIQYILDLDHKYSLYTHKLSLGKLDYIILIGALLFNLRIIFLTISLCILLVMSVGGWLWLTINCIITGTLTQLLKLLFNRDRPNKNTFGDKIMKFDSLITTKSFPSGDTSQGMTFCISVILVVNDLCSDDKIRIYLSYVMLIIFMPLVIFGRVYFGCHYYGDTIAGLILGLLSPIMFYLIYNPKTFDKNIWTPNQLEKIPNACTF